MVPEDRIDNGSMYPRLTELRSISRAIAIAVARQGRDEGVAIMATDAEIEAAVDAHVWTPQYGPVEVA